MLSANSLDHTYVPERNKRVRLRARLPNEKKSEEV